MQEIIKQIQRDLSCPVCSKKFTLDAIQVKAVFQDILVIQTTCPEGHPTLFMTIFKSFPQKIEEISLNDVLDLSNQLNDFNGDFEALWKSNK